MKSKSSAVNSAITKLKKQNWGKIPPLYTAHENVSFKRFGRRSNWGAASKFLNLKSGANAKTLFFTQFARTVQANPDLFNDIEHTTVLWSEQFLSDEAKPLVVEHGWLPRINYQISPNGANARSHVQFDSSQDFLSKLGLENLEACKRKARHFVRPKAVDIEGLTDKPFCVIPLQGGTDFNLKFSESGFDHIFGQDKANDKLAAALIERSHAEAKGMRLIITEHPTKKCQLSERPKLPDDAIFVAASQGIRSIDLAAHSHCQGVISVNSNLMHEAMLFDKPICSYGRLMFTQEDKPVFSTITELLNAAETSRGLEDQYLAMLFLNQWEISDVMDPMILRSLLMLRENATPWELRHSV